MMKRIQRNQTHKQAFTLVELLVVMAVLVLLSSLVLSALAGAAEQARENRTRSQIQKIHELLMSRYEDYRYRRVPPSKSGNVRARQGDRVDKIRELMRMEMPNHKLDLSIGVQILATSPSLWNRYRRTVIRRTGGADWAAAVDLWAGTNQESECLYMILESMQDGDTNGLDFFRESEIGDTDGDGMLEVLDGWGRPIAWIRWAPGFLGARSNLHNTNSPDPFDPLGVRDGRVQDPPDSGNYVHFPLFPVVVSAGPDGVFDVATRFLTDPSDAITGTPRNNPYYGVGTAAALGVVDTASSAHYDNITNHQLIIGGND
ncbi:MAG: prepilin-type N-terminal cleavage/methylation domain-containing protein [Pirellulaceae bacterium]